MRNKLDEDYRGLLAEILYNGVEKKDRTGTGTLSRFGHQIRHNMQDGFPLLTTKKMAIKSIMTELKWFLKGDTNIKYLQDNGCKIWDGDYNKSGRTDGELGPIYGRQWRNWNGIDQILNLVNSLKKNPDSRRLMVNAWNVSELHEMTLPPCHYGFQVYTRELNLDERIDYLNKTTLNKSSDWLEEQLDQMGVPTRGLSLSWNQRSVDTFLGLPFNIASYGMLLSLLAKEVNMVPQMLIGNLGDVHLYKNHLEQAKEQISREPKPHLPKLKLGKVDILEGEFDYEILHYHSHPPIKAPISN
jgi:thymidylate synthase